MQNSPFRSQSPYCLIFRDSLARSLDRSIKGCTKKSKESQDSVVGAGRSFADHRRINAPPQGQQLRRLTIRFRMRVSGWWEEGRGRGRRGRWGIKQRGENKRMIWNGGVQNKRTRASLSAFRMARAIAGSHSGERSQRCLPRDRRYQRQHIRIPPAPARLHRKRGGIRLEPPIQLAFVASKVAARAS